MKNLNEGKGVNVKTEVLDDFVYIAVVVFIFVVVVVVVVVVVAVILVDVVEAVVVKW